MIEQWWRARCDVSNFKAAAYARQCYTAQVILTFTLTLTLTLYLTLTLTLNLTLTLTQLRRRARSRRAG